VAFLISAAALALQLIAIRMVLVSIVETVKRGLGNVAAAALGRWVFGERVGWWQWTAVAVMAGGVALILLP
jgi:drug/metabolite transporter (DMT)-like permease